MNTATEKKKYPLLPKTISGVMQILRQEALKKANSALPNPHAMSNYQLTKLLIREAGDAMLVNPTNISTDRFDKRVYQLWNALRARLDGKTPPLLPGDEVIVGDVRGQIGEYRELVQGHHFFIQEVFYKYEIDNPYDPDWTVYISKDREGKHPPIDGWAHYDAGFFKKVEQKVAA